MDGKQCGAAGRYLRKLFRTSIYFVLRTKLFSTRLFLQVALVIVAIALGPSARAAGGAALLLLAVGPKDPGQLVAALQTLAARDSRRVLFAGQAALLAGDDRAALDRAIGG